MIDYDFHVGAGVHGVSASHSSYWRTLSSVFVIFTSDNISNVPGITFAWLIPLFKKWHACTCMYPYLCLPEARWINPKTKTEVRHKSRNWSLRFSLVIKPGIRARIRCRPPNTNCFNILYFSAGVISFHRQLLLPSGKMTETALSQCKTLATPAYTAKTAIKHIACFSKWNLWPLISK